MGFLVMLHVISIFPVAAGEKTKDNRTRDMKIEPNLRVNLDTTYLVRMNHKL